MVKSLLAEASASDPPLQPDEIGIMAPWRLQVRKLREKLREEGLHAIDVGTVEVSNSSLYVHCTRPVQNLIAKSLTEVRKSYLGSGLCVLGMDVSI